MDSKIVYFNGKFTSNTSSNLLQNRGFMYGDGLFETILMENGKLQFFEDHIERLSLGLETLRISKIELTIKELETIIYSLCKKNNLQETARIKIMMWRKPGGLYTPTDNSYSLLIETKNLILSPLKKLKLGIAKSIRLPKSSLGNLKTMNSLYYVIASIEKGESDFDDLVLLNTDNEICECTSANIFWIKNGVYYTPSLESGCIAGVRRKNFIKELRLQNKEVIEGVFKISDLKEANEIIMTNSIRINKCEIQ